MTVAEVQAALESAWEALQKLQDDITQISQDVIEGGPESVDVDTAILHAKGILTQLEQIKASNSLPGTN
jgi:uncharacterized protein YbcI